MALFLEPGEGDGGQGEGAGEEGEERVPGLSQGGVSLLEVLRGKRLLS